jgi:hypothetical protein
VLFWKEVKIMKSNWWIMAAAVALLTAESRSAEQTPVKLSDVPEVVRDQVINGMARGSPTKFYKLDTVPPDGKWQAEFQRDDKLCVLLISTKDTVVNGKTNVVITRYQAVHRPPK